MPRPLPVYSGRVQGCLYRPQQLSGSSSILEVPCQSSTNCVIKPATTKAGNAGTVAARCCQPRTMIQPGAPRNTFARDAMGAKMFSKTSWLLAGSATTDVTGENCHSHRRSTESLCVIDFPQGDGSLLVVAKVRSLQALMSAFERPRSVPQWQQWGAKWWSTSVPDCFPPTPLLPSGSGKQTWQLSRERGCGSQGLNGESLLAAYPTPVFAIIDQQQSM